MWRRALPLTFFGTDPCVGFFPQKKIQCMSSNICTASDSLIQVVWMWESISRNIIHTSRALFVHIDVEIAANSQFSWFGCEIQWWNHKGSRKFWLIFKFFIKVFSNMTFDLLPDDLKISTHVEGLSGNHCVMFHWNRRTPDGWSS